MSQNEFRKVDDFTSQYTGKWSPFDNQWFGLDFSYRGIKYRFQTWSKNNKNISVLPDGRKAVFCLMKNISINGRRYIKLGEYATMREVLISTVIERIPFGEIIIAEETNVISKD